MKKVCRHTGNYVSPYMCTKTFLCTHVYNENKTPNTKHVPDFRDFQNEAPLY